MMTVTSESRPRACIMMGAGAGAPATHGGSQSKGPPTQARGPDSPGPPPVLGGVALTLG